MPVPGFEGGKREDRGGWGVREVRSSPKACAPVGNPRHWMGKADRSAGMLARTKSVQKTGEKWSLGSATVYYLNLKRRV